MFCDRCGNEIHDKAVICVKCGDITYNPVPLASYQPMAGFFLSIFLPFIGFIVSLVQFVRALKRKGLWVFPLLGIIIGLALTILTGLLIASWIALGIELFGANSFIMI